MLKTEIVAAAEKYVAELLTQKLPPAVVYHNLQHTLAVQQAGVQLAALSGLSAEEKEIVELACLFHDTGITETYLQHEPVSMTLATNFLRQHHYPEASLTQVVDCIAATNPEVQPQGLLQEIVRDADYAHLGSPNYPDLLDLLRSEWAQVLNEQHADQAWYQLNQQFIKQHQYFTPAARATFEAMKLLNRKKLKKWVKEGRKKKGTPSAEQGEPYVSIVESRSSQMMFKTALRNHLDLSNLADNKANNMVGINAAIITFALPLLSSQVKLHPEMLLPFLVLGLACLTSMVFAILATVPIKMTGFTSEKAIQEGKSNLFFFGNFYSMTYETYRQGIRVVTSNEDKLEDSIMRDLFFLGRSLGRKYRQLRICYIIFMIGICTSVICAGGIYLSFMKLQ